MYQPDVNLTWDSTSGVWVASTCIGESLYFVSHGASTIQAVTELEWMIRIHYATKALRLSISNDQTKS